MDRPGFVGGTLRVSGGAAVGITGSSGTTSTGTLSTSGLDIPCVVKDDDDNTLLPKLPDTSQLAAAYKPAYVEPVFDVGDNNLAVPFVLNVGGTATLGSSDADIAAVEDWDSKTLNTNDFWVTYILSGFQDATPHDFDPNSEGGFAGTTAPTTGGSIIYIELHQSHEGVADPLVEEQETVVHETGHAVGNSGDEPVTLYPGQPSTLRSIYLVHIRSSSKPRG